MNVTANHDFESESDLSHIYSIVPRMQIMAVENAADPTAGDAGSSLREGDIILAVGDVPNPTYKELRDTVAGSKDKELPVTVLRVDANGIEESLTVLVTPRQAEGDDRVLVGIVPVLEAEHPC